MNENYSSNENVIMNEWLLSIVYEKKIMFFFQIVCLAMTTNERMNLSRYTHFHSTEKKGTFDSPFDRGMIQNLVDFAQFRCFGYLRPMHNDWTNQFEVNNSGKSFPEEDFCCNKGDTEPLLSVV